MSFTYNPKKLKRKKTHGYLSRKRTKSGKKIILNRIKKGRKRITV